MPALAAPPEAPFSLPELPPGVFALARGGPLPEAVDGLLVPVFETTGAFGVLPPETRGGTPEAIVSHLPAGGDLDGDGRADLLRVEVLLDWGGIAGSSITALAGPSGAPLWRVGYGAGVTWSAYLPGDLDADGRPDLAVVSLEERTVLWQYPPPGLSCIECVGYAYVAHTRLAALDGVTGSTLWSEARGVRTVYAQSMVPRILAVVHAGEFGDRYGVLAAAGDLDGDGGADLLWQTWEATYSDALVSQATSVGARSGASGRALWDAKLAGSSTEPYNALVPAVAGAWGGVDASGDGVPDVFTSEIREAGGVAVLVRQGLDGRSGAPLWRSATAVLTEGAYLSGGFMTPEGGGLLWTLGRHPVRAESLDPATGAVRWSLVAEEGAALHLAPDATGDGLGDAVVLELRGMALTLRLVDGATGATAWTRAFPDHLAGRGVEGLVVFPSLGDHDGDGSPDALVMRSARGSSGWLFSDETVLVGLRDGRDVWSRATVDDTGSRIHVPMPDLDGDARPDVMWLRASSWRDPAPSVDVRAHSGATGSELWRRDGHRTGVADESAWGVGFGGAGDVDGDGASDLFLVTLDYAKAGSRLADVLSGADGSLAMRLAVQ